MKNKTTNKFIKTNTLFPQTRRYILAYRNGNGEVKAHKISQPIDFKGDVFTAYSFGKGVRSFKSQNVLDIKEIHS